ncbi:MAG: hypothetical protein VCD00_18045 [Candidatus Hydrogenedentota bacterium]
MKPVTCIAFVAVLACTFNTSAQQTEVAQKNEQQQQLERALESLNTVISDVPSRHHHDRAEILFRLGRFEEAIKDYDTSIQFKWPHDDNSCWERGLAQYYAGDFQAGAEQFVRYHRVGALDIENGIWRFLCIAEAEGIEKARAMILHYPRKMRNPFPSLLDLYLGEGKSEAVLEEANRDVTSEEERTTNAFNAHYYLAKYYDITDQTTLARTHIQKALEYRIPHFMYACAQIDAERLQVANNE